MFPKNFTEINTLAQKSKLKLKPKLKLMLLHLVSPKPIPCISQSFMKKNSQIHRCNGSHTIVKIYWKMLCGPIFFETIIYWANNQTNRPKGNLHLSYGSEKERRSKRVALRPCIMLFYFNPTMLTHNMYFYFFVFLVYFFLLLRIIIGSFIDGCKTGASFQIRFKMKRIFVNSNRI